MFQQIAMFLLYFIGFVFLLYYLFTRSYGYWKSKGIPFDKPFLIFGSFYNVAARKENIFHCIRHIYDRYKSPYVGIYIFNQPYLMVRSPEVAKKILVKDFDKFMNRTFAANESADPITYHSVFSAKDATWRNLRSKISPVFTSGKMKLMFPLIEDCANDLTEYLLKHEGQVLDVKKTTRKYSVDVISSCAFGIDSNCLKNEDAELVNIAARLVDFTSWVRSLSVFSFFFFPRLVDIFKLTFLDKTATDYLVDVFKTTVKERKEKNIVRNDLIDLLNNLRNSENPDESYRFDESKMASQAITFFQAGNDPTAMVVTFVFYELALNKEVQNMLRKEIRETIEGDGKITYENLHGMKYLDMVFNEIMRKYPLTSFLERKCTHRYTFDETGFTLEKDIALMIPTAGLHYDPEYFPDPETFDPERFNEENRSKIKPYTFMPFGEGPRNCIGQRFGILASKMAIVQVIKDFSWETAPSTEVPLVLDPGSLFMQNRNGIFLKIIKIPTM